MSIPEGNPTTSTCHHQIEYTVHNSPQSQRWNLSGLYGNDNLQLVDLYWFGGSIEVKKTDVHDVFYSAHADTRGFHNCAIMNIHTLGTLGGFGEITVSGVNTWNLLSDSRLQFISSVEFRSIESGKTRNSYLNNYGHLDFPVNNISVNLAFNTQQLNEFTTSYGVAVTYDGWSYSVGQYYLEKDTRLFLNLFDHEFTNQVNAHGQGNIHMHQWHTSQNNHWDNFRVFFDGRWEISTLFEQDYGYWIFGSNAFITLTDVVLTDRAHVLINGSESSSGTWTFNHVFVSTWSWLSIAGHEDEYRPSSLQMTTGESVVVKDTVSLSAFTDIQLYSGEIEVSTNNPLKFENLTIHGGRLYYSDNIEVDHFVWNCGEIEGFGNETTISVRLTGSIGFCSDTEYLDVDRKLKDLIGGSKLIFLPGESSGYRHRSWPTNTCFYKY
ncbi:hypothetical protein GEMRC1_010605 [Eukaryota sp. GEM-RC1]